MTAADIGQPHLFEPPLAEHLSLADRFLVPPFSVLDGRAGYWRDRKADWLRLGIQSELGRASMMHRYAELSDTTVPCDRCQATGVIDHRRCRWCNGTGHKYGQTFAQSTSIFDPVLCEVAYRWWSPPGGLVYDPFAGGSVRGVVAACLGRRYVGVDLRDDQVAANTAQAVDIGEGRAWAHQPSWIVGDSRDTPDLLAGQRPDFVFTCPPYYDLEVYSDDPRDLSNAGSYETFLTGYWQVIRHCVDVLADDRFAAIVVGEVRAPDGGYVGLVSDTILAFQEAGASYYNELILQTPLGSAPIRTSAQFGGGRKVGKVHQNVLVFVKGDGKAAATACGLVDEVAIEYGGATWRADGSATVDDTGETLDYYDHREDDPT